MENSIFGYSEVQIHMYVETVYLDVHELQP